MAIFPDKADDQPSPLADHAQIRVPKGAGALDDNKLFVEVQELPFYRTDGNNTALVGAGNNADNDVTDWVFLGNAKNAFFAVSGPGNAPDVAVDRYFGVDKPPTEYKNSQYYNKSSNTNKSSNEVEDLILSESNMPVWARVRLYNWTSGIIAITLRAQRRHSY